MKIASKESIAFALSLLCLISLNTVTLSKAPNSLSVYTDPVVSNLERWENAFTKTIFGDGSPPFKTIIYSTPQAVWNGTCWVEAQSAIQEISEPSLDGTLYKTGTSYRLLTSTKTTSLLKWGNIIMIVHSTYTEAMSVLIPRLFVTMLFLLMPP